MLTAGHVVVHSAVIGELACGTLRERDRVFRDLQRLPGLPEPRPEEALHLVGRYRLWGRGIRNAHLRVTALGDGVRRYRRRFERRDHALAKRSSATRPRVMGGHRKIVPFQVWGGIVGVS